MESGSVRYARRNKQLAFVLTKKDKASKLSVQHERERPSSKEASGQEGSRRVERVPQEIICSRMECCPNCSYKCGTSVTLASHVAKFTAAEPIPREADVDFLTRRVINAIIDGPQHSCNQGVLYGR